MTRYTVAASALALALGFGCPGQETKKTTGPAPPTLNQPGEHHPMPIPKQNPIVPPDVRAPQHETGRERPVAAGRSGTAPSARSRTASKETGRARAAEVSEGRHEGWDKSKQRSPKKTSTKTRSGAGKR